MSSRTQLLPRSPSAARRFRMIACGVVVSLGILGLVGYQWLPSAVAGWTSIQHVSISGVDRVDRRAVLSLLELPEHGSLLSLDLAALEKKVTAHPWVSSASVGRALPHTLAVVVVERKPAGVVRHVGGNLFVDNNGAVLSIASDVPTGRLPRLVGLSAVKLLGGDPASQDRVRKGLAFAERLQRRFMPPVTVDVSDARFITGKAGEIVFFVNEDFLPTWQRYLNLEPSIRERLQDDPHDVDLRFAGKVIVRKKG